MGAEESKPQIPQSNLPQPPSSQENNENKAKNPSLGRDLSGFDPTALERGAKAMKVLQSSKHAKEAIELSFEQEKTKRQELKAQEAIIRKQSLEFEAKRDLLMEEERRKTAAQQFQYDKQREAYKQKLQADTERRKNEETREMQQQHIGEQRRLFQEQQALKFDTEKRIQEMKVRAASEQEKISKRMAFTEAEAQATALIKRDRETHDLILERKKLESTEDRTTKLEIAKTHWNNLFRAGNAFHGVLTDPRQLMLGVGAVGALFLSVYSARTLTNIVQQFFISRIGKPALVRETSRTFWRSYIPGLNLLPLSWQPGAFRVKNALEGIILPTNLATKLRWIATSTLNTRKHHAPFRHFLFHGPPGTVHFFTSILGKTLFARSLALSSGLDYAIITGGDFSSLKKDAVHQLHKVFDWASTNKRGTILFIDEADAILRRGRMPSDGDDASRNMSEDSRNVLSAFLARTGTESNKFMIVMATNIPSVFDPAVIDRIDDAVLFPLPGIEEREKMLKLYFDKYILHREKTGFFHKDIGKVKVQGFDEGEGKNIWRQIAERSEGFSGRQIAKLIITMQSAVYGGISPILTPSLALSVLEWKLKQGSSDSALDMAEAQVVADAETSN